MTRLSTQTIEITISISIIFLICYIGYRCIKYHKQDPIYAMESLDMNTSKSNEDPIHNLNDIDGLPSPINNPIYNIVLIGDSILENSYYVSSGKSVYDIIKNSVPKSTVIKNLAFDGAIITEVEPKVYQIPITYNKPTTALVLSVGGNDFLSGNAFDLIKPQYKDLLQKIRSQLDKTKIYLVNLYRPLDPSLQIYSTVVTMWNSFLEGLVKENLADAIIPISTVIVEPSDLVYKIEPSETGGEKIAQMILQTIQIV